MGRLPGIEMITISELKLTGGIVARDERELHKTIRTLKGKILQLRKQLALAEMELGNVKSLWEDEEIVTEARKIRREKRKETNKHTCSKCQADVDKVRIGKWEISRCGECGCTERNEM